MGLVIDFQDAVVKRQAKALLAFMSREELQWEVDMLERSKQGADRFLIEHFDEQIRILRAALDLLDNPRQSML